MTWICGQASFGQAPRRGGGGGRSQGAPFQIGFSQVGVHGSRGQRSRRCVGGPDLSLPGREQTPLDPPAAPPPRQSPRPRAAARETPKLAAGKRFLNQDK